MKKLESLVWQVELEEKARSLHEDITKHVNMLSWYNDSLTPQGTLLSILFLFFYSFTYFSKNIMVLSVKIITQESSKWTTKCPCEINSKREKKIMNMSYELTKQSQWGYWCAHWSILYCPTVGLENMDRKLACLECLLDYWDRVTFYILYCFWMTY